MSICRTFSDLFLIERSYQMEMEIRPGIFVPHSLETFLVERIQWIEGGQHGPFQVSEPPGFDFHALSKLASLLANEQWGLAKEMVKNLPRPPMKMEASARLGVENNNYLRKNPFRRQRRKKMEEHQELVLSGCRPSPDWDLTGGLKLFKSKSRHNFSELVASLQKV